MKSMKAVKGLRPGQLLLAALFWMPLLLTGGRRDPMQIVHVVTGFLEYSAVGVAFRIRQLLNNPDRAKRLGVHGREYVRANFLITRQARNYLATRYARENKSIIEL